MLDHHHDNRTSWLAVRIPDHSSIYPQVHPPWSRCQLPCPLSKTRAFCMLLRISALRIPFARGTHQLSGLGLVLWFLGHPRRILGLEAPLLNLQTLTATKCT